MRSYSWGRHVCTTAPGNPTMIHMQSKINVKTHRMDPWDTQKESWEIKNEAWGEDCSKDPYCEVMRKAQRDPQAATIVIRSHLAPPGAIWYHLV